MRFVANVFITTLVIATFGCGADNANNDQVAATNPEEEKTSDSTKNEPGEEENALDELRFRLDMLVANHASAPVALLMKLSKEEKDVFHPDYVNDVSRKETYNDNFSAALNFGVYKTDLIYDLVHHHLDDGLNARDAANHLADHLWEEHIYSDDDVENYRMAQDNEEELESLLFQDYERTEKYLISHDQFEIATLTMVGSLVESMYFTSKAIEEHGISESKVNLLINEKHQLHELVELLGFFKGNEKDATLMMKLEEVEHAYGKISGKKGLTEETVKHIDEAVFAVREDIVKNSI
jgi:hypothetical protein